MSIIRVIREITDGSSIVQGVTWGADRYVDTLSEGTADDVPNDAIYAAILDQDGYSELVVPPTGFVFEHHFAGWEPESFPRPVII